MKDTTGYPSAIYQGEQIYFCTQACLRAFEKDPDRFMAGEIEHPLDEVDSSAMS
ncbi:MAG TPA: YHS domain-containing protein [Anaerolineales bacterium]|nr:YHS domain-containing protein [Anaerolineales bacterium]